MTVDGQIFCKWLQMTTDDLYKTNNEEKWLHMLHITMDDYILLYRWL